MSTCEQFPAIVPLLLHGGPHSKEQKQ